MQPVKLFDKRSMIIANIPMPSDSPAPAPSIVNHLKWFRIGCLPFVIKKQSFHRISVPFVLYALAVVAANSLMVAVAMGGGSGEGLGPFSVALSTVKQLVVMVYYPLILSSILMYRKNFDKSIKKLIDLQLHMGIQQYHMFAPVKLYASIITIIILVHLGNQVKGFHLAAASEEGGVQTIIKFWLSSVFEIVTTIFQTSAFSLFSYLVCCIGSGFDKLSKTRLQGNEDIRRFVCFYNELLRISADINHRNDANITLMVFLTFLLLIEITGMILKATSLIFGDPVRILVSISLLLTMSSHIIHVCHSASVQADKANSTLVSYLVYNNQNPNFDDSYAVLHLCAKKQLSFKMCKSMVINYNLGMSMIAAYITYTIILFQIDISSSLATTVTTSPNATSAR